MQNGKCHTLTLSKDALYSIEMVADAMRLLSKALESSLNSHPFCALCLLEDAISAVTVLHKTIQ